MKNRGKAKNSKRRAPTFDLSDVPLGAIMASLSADIAASARMIRQGRDLALAVHALARRDERYKTLVADLEAVLSEQAQPETPSKPVST